MLVSAPRVPGRVGETSPAPEGRTRQPHACRDGSQEQLPRLPHLDLVSPTRAGTGQGNVMDPATLALSAPRVPGRVYGTLDRGWEFEGGCGERGRMGSER